MRLLSNKELEQLIREGEEILKQEEKKKRRMKTLIRWLVWAVILTGIVYLEMHGLRL
jgi:predicted nucleic acid-binding Zn ribbon protein